MYDATKMNEKKLVNVYKTQEDCNNKNVSPAYSAILPSSQNIDALFDIVTVHLRSAGAFDFAKQVKLYTNNDTYLPSFCKTIDSDRSANHGVCSYFYKIYDPATKIYS